MTHTDLVYAKQLGQNQLIFLTVYYRSHSEIVSAIKTYLKNLYKNRLLSVDENFLSYDYYSNYVI